jgi:RNA polymerase sigma-70 factor (ECF subfamily)
MSGDSSRLDAPALRQGSDSLVAGLNERVVALYEAHRESIYRFLVGHGLSPTIAEDVTQDVFVDLFVALEKGTAMTSEKSWLYTVAGRAAVDYWRREGRVMWVELDAEPGAAAHVPSAEPSSEVQAQHRERLRLVAAALRALPPGQRACILLRMQGLRYREIAKILRVSTSTAAEWLASAVDRLRK